jgi:hypothetical protein
LQKLGLTPSNPAEAGQFLRFTKNLLQKVTRISSSKTFYEIILINGISNGSFADFLQGCQFFVVISGKN